jgi:predicted DNA-binding transcriptional regulator AlpA
MDWLTIPQMAKQIHRDASSNLVRRYIKRFPFFFVGQQYDGVMHYPPDTLDILKRIYVLYHRKKKNRKEIEDILYSEYGNTTTIIQDPEKPQNERSLAPLGETTLPAVLPEISRLADAFERIATALENQTTISGSAPGKIENQSIQDKEILTDAETAAYLGFSKRTLRDWRQQGKGPDYIRIGSKIRYQKKDILKFLEVKKSSNTK